MNEITFVLALLFEKGLLTQREVTSLHRTLSEQTLSSNLREAQNKIKLALERSEPRGVPVETINARDILNKSLAK